MPRWRVLSVKLSNRYKERIVLKNAADDDHRMRPLDVNHRVSSEFRQMVRADDRVVMATPHIIYTRFELNELPSPYLHAI